MNRAFARGTEVAEFLFAPDNQAVIGLIRGLGGRFAATRDRAEIILPGMAEARPMAVISVVPSRCGTR
jgi:hypothetical protein